VLIVDRKSFQQLMRNRPRSSVDFLLRPCSAEELTFRVRRALERTVLQRWASHLQTALDELQLAAAAHLPVPTSADLAHLVYRDAMQIAHERAARDYLCGLPQEVRCNVVRAAKRAGLERESLHRLLRRFEIRSAAFKSNRGNG